VKKWGQLYQLLREKIKIRADRPYPLKK